VATFVATAEAVENAGQVLLADTDAVVLNIDYNDD
jgi:hypothetical protein